jgi:hypothetical protein
MIRADQGKVGGKENQRWRNCFFDEVGLFNLNAARLEGR